MNKIFHLLLLCLTFCLVDSGLAQTWTGGVGNFNTTTNWSPNTVPGIGSTANINQNNAVVTLDTTNTITRLNIVNNTGNNTASMVIETNGVLNMTNAGNQLWIAQQGNASPTGALTVKGTLNYKGIVMMSTFQNAGTTAKSSLIIDGGTAIIDQNINMGTGGASTNISSTFTLTNGGVISGLDNIFTGTGTNTFNLAPISTGIDVVNISSALSLGTGNNILNINLSFYNITNGTSMTLFTYGSKSGSWTSVSIDELGLGSIALSTPSTNYFDTGLWTGNFVVASNSIYLDNLDVIPEPSTFALLGIGACLLIARYRFKQRK